MFRIALQALAIAAIVAFVSYYFFGEQLRDLLVHEARNRQVRNVCRAIEVNHVTLDEVCHIPLPDIPKLKNHYATVKEKDGKWYQDHGWSYYPQVSCEDGRVKLDFMGKEFFCDGGDVTEANDKN